MVMNSWIGEHTMNTNSTQQMQNAQSSLPCVEYRNDVVPPLDALPACPVETTVRLIGSKWRLLILRDLLNGPCRFGALKKSVGSISQKVLTSNLREMEGAGLVVRRVYPEVPPRVEYELTATGASLRPVIDALWAWGEGYQAQARKHGVRS